MRERDLINEVEEVKNPLPKDSKDKLRNVLSNMFSTIERFEKGENIDSKSDKEKIEMLRDTIKSMIQQTDREKTIRGDGWWKI